ncbi:MAG: trypsin-like serine peptidase [Bacteriovoracaceae bacterium]
MKTSLVTLFLLSSVLISNVSAQDQRVIYGEDNRKDIFEVTNPLFINLAASTAAQISTTSLSSTLSGDIQVMGRTLVDRNICAKEKFSSQISAARCSGFLVGDDLLLTAGHCIKDQTDCNSYSWVFDFKMTQANQSVMRVKNEAVYKCSKIIARALDNATLNDFALVKLDRVVAGRKPLVLSKVGTVAVGTDLVVIGHPSGLASKVADGAKVRANTNPFYFVANTDTYGGNSGSAVFNAKTGVVEGILVRGEQDYIYDYNLSCSVSKVCATDDCRGEDIIKVDQLAKYFSSFID